MKVLGSLLLLVLLAVVAVAGLVYLPVKPASETFVELPPGASAQTMATTLEQHGVIRSRYAFLLLRAWKHGRLKALVLAVPSIALRPTLCQDNSRI